MPLNALESCSLASDKDATTLLVAKKHFLPGGNYEICADAIRSRSGQGRRLSEGLSGVPSLLPCPEEAAEEKRRAHPAQDKSSGDEALPFLPLALLLARDDLTQLPGTFGRDAASNEALRPKGYEGIAILT